MTINEGYVVLLDQLIQEREDALSIYNNSDNPLVQDFAHVDAEAASKKIGIIRGVLLNDDLLCTPKPRNQKPEGVRTQDGDEQCVSVD